jgi:hypothetical protein
VRTACGTQGQAYTSAARQCQLACNYHVGSGIVILLCGTYCERISVGGVVALVMVEQLIA